MILRFCEWLAATEGSINLHESLYMYPTVESIHVWALVLFFGMAVMLDLRERVPVEAIAGIEVGLYRMAYGEIGSGEVKWDPQTRETADHSMPYLLALGLVDGFVKADSFSPEKLRDPALRQVMAKIKIAENKEFTKQFPGKLVTQFDVTVRGGKKITLTAQYPKGHAKNPMSDAEIELKFTNLCAPLMGEAQSKAALAALWKIESAPAAGTILDLLQVRQ